MFSSASDDSFESLSNSQLSPNLKLPISPCTHNAESLYMLIRILKPHVFPYSVEGSSSRSCRRFQTIALVAYTAYTCVGDVARSCAGHVSASAKFYSLEHNHLDIFKLQHGTATNLNEVCRNIQIAISLSL